MYYDKIMFLTRRWGYCEPDVTETAQNEIKMWKLWIFKTAGIYVQITRDFGASN